MIDAGATSLSEGVEATACPDLVRPGMVDSVGSRLAATAGVEDQVNAS